MKIKTLVMLICIVSFGVADAREIKAKKTIPQSNYVATNQYYSNLISGATPNVAELNMFANMLPKGGDIHHHYSGAIYAETYLDWVGKKNYCIYSENHEQLKIEKYRIEIRPAAELAERAGQICISAAAVRKDNTFYRELLMRWSDKDFSNHFHEQPAPDQQFFDTFGFFGPVSNAAFQEGLQTIKERAKAENVQYIETMLEKSPDVDNHELAKKINNLKADAAEDEVEVALTEYSDFMDGDAATKEKIDNYVKSLEEAAAGIDDAAFKLRFQAYASRNNAPAKVFSGLYSAFAAAKESNLIVGVNIVGPENGYVAMRDYSLHMQMFRFLNQRFPGVKLSLHAGELVLGMVPPEGLKSHVREAVEIAMADRIGHGVDIAYETDPDELLEVLKERKVAIEVNLTSNSFILGVKNEAHPVQVYRYHNVPFVISTDDPGVSRNNLSNEYLLFIVRYKPSYEELKKVAYNSIRYSFLSESEKLDELKSLDKRFANFEAKVAKLASPGRGSSAAGARKSRGR
ncbi:MAG: adenosine deaminase [Deltaproteobacteria bacterium]|nr:adenosine deaminase [Deltaproteobacteria bacterium]